jgi:hypothetical protein
LRRVEQFPQFVGTRAARELGDHEVPGDLDMAHVSGVAQPARQRPLRDAFRRKEDESRRCGPCAGREHDAAMPPREGAGPLGAGRAQIEARAAE